MKKFILSLVLVALMVPSANAQNWFGNKSVRGNKEYTSESRSVSEYDQVEVQGSLDAILVAGQEGQLKVQAESNLMEYILTELENGKLKIYIEKGINLKPTNGREIKVTVPVESLYGVALTGSGDIVSTDVISAEDFRVNVTGSGDVELKLEARRVEGSLTGSGDIDLSGSAEELKCEVTGSGDFDASDFKVAHAEANVNGSGDIEVYATEALRSRVSGSGDISYKGNPKKQDFRTSGSGSISME